MTSAFQPPPPNSQNTNLLGRFPVTDVSSFGSNPQPLSSMNAMHQSNPYAPGSASGSFQSFGDVNGHTSFTAQQQPPPQIYTAVYSSVAVYEMEVQGVAVMKRRSDSWLNATQILKVAGVEKGKRTKILEKEILTGDHEKIQGGYGKYQGTWINYERGREFCRQYGVEDILRPLLDYDMSSDGTGPSGHIATPTKEQAMAANRKRFYTTGIDGRINGQTAGNTFFQNISPTASNALAHMNKAARFESPMHRPGSAQRKTPTLQRRQSSQQQQGNSSQDVTMMTSSQQSMHSFVSSDHGETSGFNESASNLQQSQYDGSTGRGGHDSQEPPRKKLRPSSSSQDPYLDPMLHEETPTEPNESFSQQQHHFARESDQAFYALVPLSPSDDRATEEKRLALLDLFADSARTDFTSHTAILHLSGQDLDIPLDASANTALHWAATLGRVGLMRLLISRGANIFRGNVAGQTALMAAVQVNNSLDHSCFPEMLEILGPLIELRDATGRTVLHHIAVASGIKGRGPSSRYYLESLLEFTVRQGSNSSVPSSQQESFDNNNTGNKLGVHSKMKPITLSRFMSDVVNVQDKGGNTALNLVARIGNHVIINQLDEIGADYSIANHTGFRPTDFGVFPRSQAAHASANPASSQRSEGQSNTPSQIDLIKEEIFATTTSILTQTHSHYTNELNKTQSVLDAQTTELREIAAEHKSTSEDLTKLEKRWKERAERRRKIVNLRQHNAQKRQKLHHEEQQSQGKQQEREFLNQLKSKTASLPASWSTSSQETTRSLPSATSLQEFVQAYKHNNEELASRLANLQSRSSELENQYRRVVSLCTGVEESKVEEMLEALLAAMESEGGPENLEGAAKAGRVRGFLRLVEGVE